MPSWGGVNIPGFSLEGLLFFSTGAHFAIHHTCFPEFFKQHWIVPAVISIPLLVIMVITHGNNDNVYLYARHLFVPLGVVLSISLVATLIENGSLRVNHFLSRSSFFVYAAHNPIINPMQFILGILLPSTQAWMIVRYFAVPATVTAFLVLIYAFLSRRMSKMTAVITGGRIGY